MATYYVATTGNDTTGNGTSGTPWATIGKAAGTGLASGDIVEIAPGTYTLTATVTPVGTGSGTEWVTFRGAAGSLPIITSATNGVDLFTLSSSTTNGFYFKFQNLKLTHTASTRGYGIVGASYATNALMVVDCVFDGVSSATWHGYNVYDQHFYRCAILNTTSNAFSRRWNVWVDRCFIYNCNGGIYDDAGNYPGYISNSVIAACGSYGVSWGNTTNYDNPLYLYNTTIANHTGDGVVINSGNGNSRIPILSAAGNIFYGNGGYGLHLYKSPTAANLYQWGYNAFGANTSGAYLNLSDPGTNITLTANPFVNGSSGNFALNTTAGGGAAARAANFPGAFGGGLTTGYLDLGAVQHQDPASVTVGDLNATGENDVLTALQSTFPAGSSLNIYTGTSPGSGNAATGTLLASITLPTSPWASPSSGSMAKQNTWSATASGTGTAGYGRLVNAADTKRLDFTVTATGGGGQVTLDNTSISSGNTVTVSSFTLSKP